MSEPILDALKQAREAVNKVCLMIDTDGEVERALRVIDAALSAANAAPPVAATAQPKQKAGDALRWAAQIVQLYDDATLHDDYMIDANDAEKILCALADYVDLHGVATAQAPVRSASPVETVAFRQRVQPWMMACFGAEISADTGERNHRFFEESTELVQACGMTQSEAHQLVDYVYGRPSGEKHQEVGGVMVTLAALCLAQGLDMHDAGETELARIWTKVEQIRAKQAAKPKHSPLPVAISPVAQQEKDAERWRMASRLGLLCHINVPVIDDAIEQEKKQCKAG